jgi:hydroxymethylpyrimidine/phosphomethylpyrimidine kinase
VLAASGLDPTGSAGLLADIRVMSALGCHPCGVVTCETVQSSQGLTETQTADPAFLHKQLYALMSDISIRAAKVGAISSPETAMVLGAAFYKTPYVPVVVDPVLRPSRGPAFLDPEGFKTAMGELLPLASIATPNVHELGALAGTQVNPADDSEILEASKEWLRSGVRALLVTGLRREDRMVDRLIVPAPDDKLDSRDFSHVVHDVGEVHGTGCVLSSAIAAFLAHGLELNEAVKGASEFTIRVIGSARKYGGGAAFWVDAGQT